MPIQFPYKLLTAPGTYQIDPHVQDIQIRPASTGNFIIYLQPPVPSMPVFLRINPKVLSSVTVYAQSGKEINSGSSYSIPAAYPNSVEQLFVFWPELSAAGTVSGNWTVKRLGTGNIEVLATVPSTQVLGSTTSRVGTTSLPAVGRYAAIATVTVNDAVAGMRVGLGYGLGASGQLLYMFPDALVVAEQILPNNQAAVQFSFNFFAIGTSVSWFIYNGNANPKNFLASIGIEQL